METNILQQALDRRLAQAGPDSIISLIDSDFHANGFMLPPDILESGFRDYLARRRYSPDPLGLPAAREAVAEFYNLGGPVSRTTVPQGSGTAGWASSDNVILTASSSESYNLLFQAFTEPGDNVLLPLPAYPLFEDLCRYNRIEPRFYPLGEARGWQADLDVFDSLCDERTRFVVLISPNNPCGSVLETGVLARILEICRRHAAMVISDEVFSEFLYETNELPRAAALDSQVPVFTINGISKLFACPDLKLSWILLGGPCRGDPGLGGYPTSQELVAELELRNDTFLNCNSFSQFLLPRLFRECGGFVRDMVAACRRNRDCLEADLLPHLPTGMRLILPRGGIHCLLSFSAYSGFDDEALALALLEHHGLYLHPGYLYGVEESPCLVLSILKQPELFALAVAKLAQALNELL